MSSEFHVAGSIQAKTKWPHVGKEHQLWDQTDTGSVPGRVTLARSPESRFPHLHRDVGAGSLWGSNRGQSRSLDTLILQVPLESQRCMTSVVWLNRHQFACRRL